MKKNFLTSTVVASILFGAVALYAESAEKVSKHTKSFESVHHMSGYKQQKAYVDKEIQLQTKEFKNAPKEVLDGLQNTLEALRALQNGDDENAKDRLAQATKLFNKALKDDPKLGLVPITNSININEVQAKPKDIKETIDLVKDLLADYRIQDARDILIPLKDDVEITTNFIPMEIYPIATKKALDTLDKGQKDAALEILVSGLSTVVTQKIRIPISLLKAEDLLIKASNIDKSKKKEAHQLLQDANEQLEKALLLGYTDRHSKEYKTITKEIEVIQKEIKGKNEVEKLYERTKEFFGSLLHKTRNIVYKIKSDSKEADKNSKE